MYDILLSLLNGASMFFVSYFTCWLFFSKRISFLEEYVIDLASVKKSYDNYHSENIQLLNRVYGASFRIQTLEEQFKKLESKQDILNRISHIEGKLECKQEGK